MPAKGKTKISPRQRSKIAAGRLLGKRSKQIAQETGLQPQTVRKEAHDPRTVTQILTLKQQHEQEFAKMFSNMVKGLGDDIKSKDFTIRHAARGQFLRTLTAGDPPLHRVGDMGSTGGDFTLEEMLITLRRITPVRLDIP